MVFPGFLRFEPEFCIEMLINWATVSSRSCFCSGGYLAQWLSRQGPGGGAGGYDGSPPKLVCHSAVAPCFYGGPGFCQKWWELLTPNPSGCLLISNSCPLHWPVLQTPLSSPLALCFHFFAGGGGEYMPEMEFLGHNCMLFFLRNCSTACHGGCIMLLFPLTCKDSNFFTFSPTLVNFFF